MEEEIDLTGIGGELLPEQELVLSNYIKTNKLILRESDSKEVVCECGEVVWMYKDTVLCPTCFAILQCY